MKKILSSIKDFLVKHKLIVLITLGVILVLIALLVVKQKPEHVYLMVNKHNACFFLLII